MFLFVSMHFLIFMQDKQWAVNFRSTLKFSSVSPSLVLALRIMDATYLFTRLRMTSWGLKEKKRKQTIRQNSLILLIWKCSAGSLVWRCKGKERQGKQSQRRSNVMQLHAHCLYSRMCVIAELYLLAYLIMLILYQPVSMLFLKGETDIYTVIMQGNWAY